MTAPLELSGQPSKTVLSVAIPSFYKSLFTTNLFAQFEATHPSTQVKLIVSDATVAEPDIEPNAALRLKQAQQFAESADVMLVGGTGSPEPLLTTDFTRLGYFLNLKPLADSDPNTNPAVFPPALWQAFQWDGGLWAIPTAVEPSIFYYDPHAFDRANLAYPNEHWTFDDLVTAIMKLAQPNADGRVTSAVVGADDGAVAVLFQSLLGKPLFDGNTSPTRPLIDQPELEGWLNIWADLERKGYIGYSGGTAPIGFSGIFGVQNSLVPRVAMLMPGGKAGLKVKGFAVSAGTIHPELAYDLARFLATESDFSADLAAFYRNAVLPARQDLYETITQRLNPNLQPLMPRLLAAGLNNADQRYVEYLHTALSQITITSTAGIGLLQDAQDLANRGVVTAAESQYKINLVIKEPPDVPPLPPGKVALHFGFNLPHGSFPMPDALRQKLRRLADSFIAQDAIVAQIDIADVGPSTANDVPKNYDCFYDADNLGRDIDSRELLPLDPLLAADPMFKSTDWVAGTLSQVQRQNQTWALPITVIPSLLRYTPSLIDPSDLPLLTNNWTASDFTTLLKRLKQTSYTTPFASYLNDDPSYWLLLIASFGGLPIDYRTNPPTVDFTATDTVDAIRQVLDLAKTGYLDYQALGESNPSPPKPMLRVPPLGPQTIDVINPQPAQNTDQWINYPRGDRYIPLSYTIGAAYISANTTNADACYRWISALAHDADLLPAMPANRVLLDDPILIAAQGKQKVQSYRVFDALINDQKAILFPPQSADEYYWLKKWLFRAFDGYVLKGQALEPALADAQDIAQGFLGCVAALPPFDPTANQPPDYTSCAKKVDPLLSQ